MTVNHRLRNFLEGTILFCIGFFAGSSLLVCRGAEWYCASPVLPLLAGAAALLGGTFAGKTVRGMNPVFLAILSGGMLIIQMKGFSEGAVLLALMLAGMVMVNARNLWSIGAGLLLGGLLDIGIDFRFRLFLWAWLMVLPASVLVWREFLHYRTWCALIFSAGLLLFPASPPLLPDFPGNGALPALLIPDTENLRIGYILPAGCPENISGKWEQFPFVEKVMTGSAGMLRQEQERPFDLIVFDRQAAHSAAGGSSLLKLAWEQLSANGVLIVPAETVSTLPVKEKFPLPGTQGRFSALLKGKGQTTLSQMDKKLQTHLRACGQESAFMPPGVFKALFYEDVYPAESRTPGDIWRMAGMVAGAVALIWWLIVLCRPGRDGSVWGNGCWFGLLSAVLICRSAAWEFNFPAAWFWLPLLCLTGLGWRYNSNRFARYALAVSAVVPFGILLGLEPWNMLAVALVSACCCGIVHYTLAARCPARSGVLFCKYIAGSICGILISYLFPGNILTVLAVLALLRFVAVFRF